jgi:hypothetical protein
MSGVVIVNIFCIALVLVLVLLLCVAACLCCKALRRACNCDKATGLRRLWRALHPDFTRFNTGHDTTQTFHMLVAAMLIFSSILLLWAVGAGGLRAALLYPHGPHDPDTLTDADIQALLGQIQGWLFLIIQVVRAIGGVLLLCLAAGLVGALLGFLFGIPRPMSAAEAPPAAAGGAPRPSAASSREAARAWELSTNLTQISDWLTKIIVGVGLVEAKTGSTAFLAYTDLAASWLFNMRHGSPAVIPAALIGGAIFGFLFAYLYTELIVARLIAAADAGLTVSPDPAKTQPLQDIQSIREALVPRISRSSRPTETTDQPTLGEVNAALQYRSVQLDDLTDRRNVLNWSRAKAILNDYQPAAQGYVRLLGMDGGAAQAPDLALLIETARVLNAAGELAVAATLVEVALRQVAGAAPEVQAAIIGDAVALRLSGRLPGGYQAALDLLQTPQAQALIAATPRLLLLRALANGQKHAATTFSAATRQDSDNLRNAVLADLRSAFASDPTMPRANIHFLDGSGPSGEHDLRSFQQDPEFRQVFNLP